MLVYQRVTTENTISIWVNYQTILFGMIIHSMSQVKKHAKSVFHALEHWTRWCPQSECWLVLRLAEVHPRKNPKSSVRWRCSWPPIQCNGSFLSWLFSIFLYSSLLVSKRLFKTFWVSNNLNVYTLRSGTSPFLFGWWWLEPWNFEWLSRNSWEWNNHPKWLALHHFSEG